MADRSQPLYLESQPFRHWHVRVALAVPPLALLVVACRQIFWHKAWTSPPLSNGDLIFLTLLLSAVYVRLNTVRLVTEVLPGEVVIRLRGIWKTRRIQVSSIQSAAEIQYDPAADFGGYGIRSGRGGLAYIAHGDRAVELALEDGGKLFIGSQHPDELAARIRQRIVS